jgi:hypothetical protein
LRYPPNASRGFIRLRFRISGYEAIAAALGERTPRAISTRIGSLPVDNALGEFVIGFHQPSLREQYGPTIVSMRDGGSTWPEVQKATGVSIGNAAYIYRISKKDNGGLEES